MDSTKSSKLKKSSSTGTSSTSLSKQQKKDEREREREREKKEQQQQQQQEDEEMSDIQSSQKEKEKKKKSSSKREKSSTQTPPVDIDQAAANSPSSPEHTSSNNSVNPKTPTHQSTHSAIPPMTPLTKFLNQSTLLQSPSRLSTSNRLKEKEDLVLLTQKLRELLAIVEEKNNQITKLKTDHENLAKSNGDLIHSLQNRLEDSELRITSELQINAELTTKLQITHSDLMAKEQQLANEIALWQSKIDEAVNAITEENTRQILALRQELNKKVIEAESLKSDVKQLNADLLTKGKESDEKSRRLLEAEYTRMKTKEENLKNEINLKDVDIKKLKLDLREKEKAAINSQRRENELQQTIESYERQQEDIRDSINREWEIKLTSMWEEQNVKFHAMELQVNSFEQERETFRQQLGVTQSQVEELTVKNQELSDSVHQLEGDLKNKEANIAQLNQDLEESKKSLRRIFAESKKKDSTIGLLQDENNAKEMKCNHYQSEIAKLRKELNLVNAQNADPMDVPLTKEIDQLKKVVYGFEKSFKKRKNHHLNGDHDDENEENNGETLKMEISNGTFGEPQGDTGFKLNTLNIMSVDGTHEVIKLCIRADFGQGFNISGMKLVVTKPDNTRLGFEFPVVTPYKGLTNVTVWTGRSRPTNTTTPDNEFYWARNNIWDQLDQTNIKLISTTEDVLDDVTLPSNGIYTHDSKNQNNCLIM